MDYREFICAVEQQMNQKLTGGVKAALHTAVKNNGKERKGVLIETPGVNISPTIYLEEYYERYLQGASVERIVEEIIGFYGVIRQEKSWDYEKMLCYESVKERLVFKLVNTDKNRDYLEQIPHIAFLDLAVVFYILLEITEEGTASMTVTSSHIRHWGVQTGQLWEDAVKNVKQILPAEFFTMKFALSEFLGQKQGKESVSENLFIENTGCGDGMYVLSNPLRNYGAACIAYPHVAEMIGDILGSDYYILPSSVHEVIITPVNDAVVCSDLEEMVQEINETQVADEEILSDHVYCYRRNTGKLYIGPEQIPGRMIG